MCCILMVIYCIVLRIHSRTQGARLQTCVAVTRYTQIRERARRYIRGSSIECKRLMVLMHLL